METQTPDMDLNWCDVIFKTIYLFLESNDFQQTATSFLAEIKSKYNQDIDLINTQPAKTLILRPIYNRCLQDDTSLSTIDKLIVTFPGDEPNKRYQLPAIQTSNTNAKERTVIFNARTRNLFPTPSNGGKCAHDPATIPNSSCPDCQKLIKYDRICQMAVSYIDDKDSIDWKQMQRLGDDVKELRQSHQRLINLATELTGAISSLKPEPKEHLLTKYQQQIYELYSYPGSHHETIDVVLMLQEQDDKTEYQVESSVINSSNNSANKLESYNDPFIPLESKRVVGNIPNLIANPPLPPASMSATSAGDSTSISTSNNFNTDSCTTINMGNSSQFSDDFPMAPTPIVQVNHARMFRINKSATLPVLRVGDIPAMQIGTTPLMEGRSKSRSASFLETRCLGHQVERTKIGEKHEERVSAQSTTKEHANGNGDVSKDVKSESYRFHQLQKQLEHLLLIGEPGPPPNPQQGNTHDLGTRTSIVINYTDNGAGEVEVESGRGPGGSSESDTSTSDIIDTIYETCDGPLDWVLLKKTLFEGDANVKLKLLQALRWRLTKTDKSQRDKHLLNYVKYDILSINTIPPYGQLFLESFYCPTKIPTPHPLQEEMARFINTLASLAMGRLYLERDESILSVMLLPLLMGKLPGIKIFDLTREFTMATVQKLSLSNKMREVIIAAGTVEWLIGFIEKHHASGLSTYEAEYSVALLTNLCINKEARNRCERVADRVVTVIMDLIATPHECCIHYINPILYSLLLNPLINEKAVSRGIGMRLKDLYVVFRNDDELKRQLDAILTMHETRDFCECDDCDTEDLNCQNYADYLEPDLNLKDAMFTPPSGEDLLRTFLNVTALNVTKSKSELIKRLSSVQIVKKNCVCNNKSISRIEHKLIEETTARSRQTGREKSMNRSIPEVKTTSRTMKTKSDRFVPFNTSKSKTTLRRRSLSQPPILKGKVIPKVDSRRRNNVEATRTNAPPQPAPPITNNALPSKVKKYIVNCCYKVDYTNAVGAPPGEFAARPLPALPPSGVASCTCYNQMKSFVEALDVQAKEVSELRNSVTVKCANCQHAMPVLQMESFPSTDTRRGRTKVDKLKTPLQLTDYHVVSSGAESAILGAYKPKIKR